MISDDIDVEVIQEVGGREVVERGVSDGDSRVEDSGVETVGVLR